MSRLFKDARIAVYQSIFEGKALTDWIFVVITIDKLMDAQTRAKIKSVVVVVVVVVVAITGTLS